MTTTETDTPQHMYVQLDDATVLTNIYNVIVYRTTTAATCRICRTNGRRATAAAARAACTASAAGAARRGRARRPASPARLRSRAAAGSASAPPAARCRSTPPPSYPRLPSSCEAQARSAPAPGGREEPSAVGAREEALETRPQVKMMLGLVVIVQQQSEPTQTDSSARNNRSTAVKPLSVKLDVKP